MSGIAGIINLDARPVESAWLEVMANHLSHRGRDGCGLWLSGNVGLCHQALWTTPEACLESLPMEVAEGLVITGDVRLDNREELLGLLDQSTHLFAGAPDCALLVAAYSNWGENCVEHLLGDFAFAIWDKTARKLFCARDHMGVKPFYYAELPGRRLVFGSEVKAVLSVPGIGDALNEKRIADAFVHLFNDPTATYYSTVLRLPAAHCLTATAQISTRRYWRLNPGRELLLGSDHEYAEGFYNFLSQAVQSRLRSNYPVGSMLSGGLDSSSVSCIARDGLQAKGGPKLRTFSAVFDEVIECDERPYIQTVLEQGHCEPHFIVLDSLSPLSDAKSIMWHLDEPVSAGNLYLGWNAFRRAQGLGVRVILDGFDGDTTVSHGLGRLLELARAGNWLDLAVELAKGSKNFENTFWPHAWWRWVWKYHPITKRVDRFWAAARRRMWFLGRRTAANYDPIAVLNPEFARKLDLRQIAQEPSPPVRLERDRHFQLLEREIMTQSVELLAKTSGAFDVEARFPFLDVRLIEYCLSLPSNQKMRGGYTRLVMRNGMAGVLPEKIRWRPGKSNLGPSFDKGLFKFERDNLRKIIFGQADQLASYVDVMRIKDSLKRFEEGAAHENDSIALWTAAGLALWLSSRCTGTKATYTEQRRLKMTVNEGI